MLRGRTTPVFGCVWYRLPAPFKFIRKSSWAKLGSCCGRDMFQTVIRYCTCIFVGKSKRKKHPVAIHHNHMTWDCACCSSCFHTGIVGHCRARYEVLSGLLAFHVSPSIFFWNLLDILQSAMFLPRLLNLAIAFRGIFVACFKIPPWNSHYIMGGLLHATKRKPGLILR